MELNWQDEYRRYHRYFFDLKKKSQSPKARSFAWISLTVFTISFFIIVAIKPTLVTIAKLNREIKDKEEALQKLQTKINSLVAAQQEFAANIDNLSLLDEALPEKNDFPQIAYFVEQTAVENQVSLQSLNFEKIGPVKSSFSKNDELAAKTSFLNFSLSVSGNYNHLKNFLNEIESARRLVQIQRTNFNQLKKEDSSELLLAISGTAFYDKEGP